MNRALVDDIARAVLYEGYILYPYRPSSAKNRQRFTFGRVYPEAYGTAQQGKEPSVMQTECLVRAPADARLDVGVRFLHPTARRVGRLRAPAPELSPGTDLEIVHEMHVGGRTYASWHEAVEREVRVPPVPLGSLERRTLELAFRIPPYDVREAIRNRAGDVIGAVLRRREALRGTVAVAAARVDEHVFRLTVRVVNTTPWRATVEDQSGDDLLLRTLASTHTVLHLEDGAFISSMDPPAAYAEAASACVNTGTWPVLVGEEGAADTMLSAPIILYDYPQIAPESAGDLFDGTEIDELLTLRIMTMTDEEKREMHDADVHARRILQRTSHLPDGDLMRMHGTFRDGRSSKAHVEQQDADFFGRTRRDAVTDGGTTYRPGDRVRIRPRARADIMDLALEGRTAVIEAVEQDLDDRVYLALVLEDDPGRELGMMRQPGHRFFYAPDEVELLGEGTS